MLSRHALEVWLVVSQLDSDELITEVKLDRRKNKTGDHWHVQIGGLPPTFCYGWRVDGPREKLNRFDPSLVLLDPSATALTGGGVWGVSIETNKRFTARRSVFMRRSFHWREDHPLLTPLEDTIIYELHVRGFTCHQSAAVAKPGTFAALMQKIPYLKDLGITAVELLPIHEFDEEDCPFSNPSTGAKLRNFWGYNSYGFAAPKASFAASGPEYGQITEFREMVRAFHEAGIEVILDVVFNHTGEGDDRGRTYSFRGLDNQLYYMLDQDGSYLNFSGCGNTVNCNHPVVRQMLMTCLRYWVGDMHVDGLRFDLASVFGRDTRGNVLVEPPVVELIAEDSVLADTKLIAEPWDAAGLYQVGRFPFGRRWSEWNARYRDEVRRFWRGEPGFAGALATRLCGSSDLYQTTGRDPRHSINFLTCHDGFTLWDLVSYNQKHNEANGEDNRDGLNDNCSWNCGVEGPSNDPEVLKLRRRQARNLMATLLLSQGVPMLLAGDEFLRTQGGNNNAWCQDNGTSWVDWELVRQHGDFLRFVREFIALRKRHCVLRRRSFLRGTDAEGKLPPDIVWHGTELGRPDFSSSSKAFAFVLDGSQHDHGGDRDRDVYIACNAGWEPLAFLVPPAPSGQPWRLTVDTAQEAPADIVGLDKGPAVLPYSRYDVTPYSLIVLVSAATPAPEPTVVVAAAGVVRHAAPATFIG
jgi:isoamylase